MTEEEVKRKAALAILKSKCVGKNTLFPRVYWIGNIVTFFKHVAIEWGWQTLGYSKEEAELHVGTMTHKEAYLMIYHKKPDAWYTNRIHENIETESLEAAHKN